MSLGFHTLARAFNNPAIHPFPHYLFHLLNLANKAAPMPDPTVAIVLAIAPISGNCSS